MNIMKHSVFFDPINDIKHSIHILGCGAVGSNIAEMLTRMGTKALHLYDMDIVHSHNITNQIYTQKDILSEKITALNDILKTINPAIDIIQHPEGYINQPLAGYVFLCVDNIDLRRQIIKENQYNHSIKAVFDFRMRLTDAQHYAANWQKPKDIEELLNTMNFTHEESLEITPINACGSILNIIPTVKIITALGLSNFINFIKNKSLKKIILIDAFIFGIETF